MPADSESPYPLWVDGKLVERTKLEEFSGAISRKTLAWNMDGTQLVVAGKEMSIQVWNMDSKEISVEIQAKEYDIRDIAYVSETQTIGITEQGQIILVNLASREVASIHQFDGTLTAMAWNPAVNQLSVAGYTTTDREGIAQTTSFTDTLDVANLIAEKRTQP